MQGGQLRADRSMDRCQPYPTVVIVDTLHQRPSSTPSRYALGNIPEFVPRSTAHMMCPDTKMASTSRQIKVRVAMLKFEAMLAKRSVSRADILVTKENPSLRPKDRVMRLANIGKFRKVQRRVRWSLPVIWVREVQAANVGEICSIPGLQWIRQRAVAFRPVTRVEKSGQAQVAVPSSGRAQGVGERLRIV